MKRKLIFAGGMLVIIAATLFHRWGRKDDPVISGKHLSGWCRQLISSQANSNHEDPGRVEAETAIRCLGTNAIKPLLSEMYATNSPGEVWWMHKKADVRNWVMGKLSDDYESIPWHSDPIYAGSRNYAALLGLRAVGLPARSLLIGCLHDVDQVRAQTAACMVASMWPDGPELLLPALNDPDAAIRQIALSGLRYGPGDDLSCTSAAVLIPALFGILDDNSRDHVERSSAAVLLVQWSQPKLQIVSQDRVIRALIKHIPENIGVALLSDYYFREGQVHPYHPQLLELLNSGTLLPGTSNTLLHAMEPLFKPAPTNAEKLVEEPMDKNSDAAAFEARFGK